MKHATIVKRLERIVNSEVHPIISAREEEYDLNDGQHGEIDYYCIKDNTARVYEVKTHDKPLGRHKAYHQLHKDVDYMIQEHLGEFNLIKRYFVYSDCGLVIVEHLDQNGYTS